MGNFGGFLIAVVIFLAIATIIAVCSTIAKKKRTTCKACGTKYDYEEDISWELMEQSTTLDAHNNPKVVQTVDVTCECPNCDAIKKLTRKYVVLEYVKRGNDYDKKEYFLEDLVRKDFS